MNESLLFNILMILFAVGIVGLIFTSKPKGDGIISSFDIVTIMTLAERKSNK